MPAFVFVQGMFLFLLLWMLVFQVRAETPLAGITPQMSVAAPAAVATPASVVTPAVAPTPPAVAPTAAATLQPAQMQDYKANLSSDVFGAQLFTGAFAGQGATQFNPDYLIAVGDSLQIRMWGAFSLDAMFVVDPQGNIFLPNVGPVRALGAKNKDLQELVDAAVRKVYRANVQSYATLAAAQPVRVFVSGFVRKPGLYNGTSMDSLLHYLDLAGGIDPERGSFLGVEVKRGGKIRATVNLYDFLLKGNMPQIQFSDGDVIFVTPRQHTVKVAGLVENAKRFEFSGDQYALADLVRLVKPFAQATHVRVVRNTGTVKNVEYYSLDMLARLSLFNGDEVEFTADKKPGTITVRVEGEHQSAQEYVLPYGTRLGDVMKRIEFSERSDSGSLQLQRLSVRERQKAMLASALKSLESSVLTARSSTNEESRLRKDEAELILQWVDRARLIEPSGQVVISDATERDSLLLENGDVIRVPTRDGLVLVSGEVLFPNAVAYDPKLGLSDYIRLAGGYAQSADTSRVIIAHANGSFQESGKSKSGGFFGLYGNEPAIQAGDEILVLPNVQTKSIEVTRGITQIIYQIAVAAKVIFDL